MSATKPLAAKLRHRITVEQQTLAQDPSTGAMAGSWVPLVSDLPAAVEPLSGREYLAAAQIKSAITARVTVRYRDDLNPTMRINHHGQYYKIQAILPDPNSGREWLTLMVESA